MPAKELGTVPEILQH